ncbi:MAG: L-seryl-tRNA(Sec) selenium transferase [Candidatus Omnitrophota bacterium]
MNKKNNQLRRLPGVDAVLNEPGIKKLITEYGRDMAVYSARKVISAMREEIKSGGLDFQKDILFNRINDTVYKIARDRFKPVINATGILIHTNLGRAPLGEYAAAELEKTIAGYTNLEFDLATGRRGRRNDLIAPLINFLTGAEDSLVVNNNAAALLIILHTFARGKEVIVSRGELVEIGDSFRIPDMLRAAGAKMVEVGTTNRTRLCDYEKALTPRTALILKVHKSNYAITGFTEEVSVKDLSGFSHKQAIPFVYDIGSGLLRKPKGFTLENEPEVKGAIGHGADMVTFSGDKLIGGPQAGIITGRKDLIRRIARAPMMRALRVGKLTLAALIVTCRQYLNDKERKSKTPLFTLLERSKRQRKEMAVNLMEELRKQNIAATMVKNKGCCGGGTLPELYIDSFAVCLNFPYQNNKERVHAAEKTFRELLRIDKPIIAILRKGEILFDVLALLPQDIPYIAEQAAKTR